MDRQRRRHLSRRFGIRRPAGWRETGRISTFEPLELRTLLSVNAVTIAAWHNAADPGDVNDDGQVTPLDARPSSTI